MCLRVRVHVSVRMLCVCVCVCVCACVCVCVCAHVYVKRPELASTGSQLRLYRACACNTSVHANVMQLVQISSALHARGRGCLGARGPP